MLFSIMVYVHICMCIPIPCIGMILHTTTTQTSSNYLGCEIRIVIGRYQKEIDRDSEVLECKGKGIQ